MAFLRAKRDADALRPPDAKEALAKSRWDDYRNAVNAFVVAFEVAEKEARRVRDSAYKRARRELDGVIVLPEVTIAALEQKVARMLDGPNNKAL